MWLVGVRHWLSNAEKHDAWVWPQMPLFFAVVPLKGQKRKEKSVERTWHSGGGSFQAHWNMPTQQMSACWCRVWRPGLPKPSGGDWRTTLVLWSKSETNSEIPHILVNLLRLLCLMPVKFCADVFLSSSLCTAFSFWLNLSWKIFHRFPTVRRIISGPCDTGDFRQDRHNLSGWEPTPPPPKHTHTLSYVPPIIVPPHDVPFPHLFDRNREERKLASGEVCFCLTGLLEIENLASHSRKIFWPTSCSALSAPWSKAKSWKSKWWQPILSSSNVATQIPRLDDKQAINTICQSTADTASSFWLSYLRSKVWEVLVRALNSFFATHHR